MKRFALLLVIFAFAGLAVIAQSSRTRPRVVPTPTPAPTPIVVDGYEDDVDDEPVVSDPARRRPTLQGDQRVGNPNASPTPPDGDDEVIRVETNLVTLPVSVFDRSGRFVGGLEQRDFQIFENGKRQEIGFFQSVEQPFTVILMIDVSPSTAFQIGDIQNAAITFTEQLRQNDRVMVVAFDQRARVLTRPTNNRAEIARAIRQAEVGNGTSIYSAVDQMLNREFKMIEGRKAIVVFSDGVDTTSGRRSTFESTLRDAEETDVLIYSIRYNTQRDYGRNGGGGVYNPQPRRRGGGGWGDILGAIITGGSVNIGGGGNTGAAGTSPEEYARGRQYLETLSRNSGGRSFEADSLRDLDSAYSGIAEELRRQYSVGFYPDTAGQAGERRQLRVRVMRPNLVVRARNSYIVGSGDRSYAGN
ncbi:MAG: VWA domain-containing protein [Acidobacteria bacterium]|nr:VWA domain-containing protein [Acidobacteriota bacterium]